jgi:hypothetical protein
VGCGRGHAEDTDGLPRARASVFHWDADYLLGEPSHEVANAGEVTRVLGEWTGEPDDLRCVSRLPHALATAEFPQEPKGRVQGIEGGFVLGTFRSQHRPSKAGSGVSQEKVHRFLVRAGVKCREDTAEDSSSVPPKGRFSILGQTIDRCWSPSAPSDSGLLDQTVSHEAVQLLPNGGPRNGQCFGQGRG